MNQTQFKETHQHASVDYIFPSLQLTLLSSIKYKYKYILLSF